jgi:hypothetical protein
MSLPINKTAEEFISWVRHSFLATRDDEKEIPQLKILKPKILPDIVVQKVCKEFNCSKEFIIRKGRKNNSDKDIAICLAMSFLKEDRNLKAKFDRASHRIFNI